MKFFYQDNMYGRWRAGEKVGYELQILTISDREPEEKSFFYIPEPNHAAGKYELKIKVEAGGKQVSFTTVMYLPKADAKAKFAGKCPFIVCMHPIKPRDYALSQGLGIIELDTKQIAEDNCKHEGCFYDLYPYGAEESEQTGVLMAWAWGASKIMDAVEAGLGEEAGLDAAGAVVTGVSRWGKATAVCGAFEERFALTVPACSGAGGLAMNRVVSEGNTYNFESIGGPAAYTYGQNEPLSCLQSEAERGWFNDKYLQYRTMDEIPFEQYHLPVLAADKNRYYMMIAACMGEDWVNAPAMWECYKKANEIYDSQGLGEHLIVHFHKEGHAVTLEDMELLIGYFNYMKYGIGEKPDMAMLKTTVFEGQ